MREYENQCVGCPPEIGCIGSVCPYSNVPIDYCDWCGNEGAEYRINGEDYCENCIKKFFQMTFDDLSISEKAEALNIDISKIN